MNKLATKAIVEVCRMREREGDCPYTTQPHASILESVILELALQLESGKAQTAPAVEDWVPCEERMPEVHTTVLVVCRSRVYPDRLEPGFRLARLDDDGEWIEADSLDEIRRVVRWLPIPEPR